MKTRFRPAILLVAVLLLASCAPQSPNYLTPGLTVTGTGSVKVEPDLATVTVGVQTQNAQISTAVADNNRRADRIRQAVIEMGVAEGDIRTTYFTVWSQPGYDEFGTLTDESTYFVDNSILVTVRDVSQLGGLLQAAIDAGANSIQGISFHVEDPAAAEDQARQEAVFDAQAKARELATAAGSELGEVTTISTNVYFPFGGPVYERAAFGLGGGGGDGGPPVATGSYEVQVQITITYTIR